MRKTLIAALLVSGVIAAAAVAAETITGPSSSQSPYVVPSQEGVVTKSILTVGDSVGGYRMVGIPDGLGAAKDKAGDFTLFMNHELSNTRGIPRAHGAAGAFVSQYSIDRHDLSVNAASDLIQQISLYNAVTGTYNPGLKGIALKRLCSANLPARSALYDKRSKLGYDGRIFMSGEEAGAEGRAFAHVETGTSYELPALGKFSWENSVANPATGRKTVVVGTDDSTPGQVYVYVGEKKSSGNPAERAGLTGGNLFGIKVSGLAGEPLVTGIPSGTPFTAANLGNVSAKTGAQLQAESVAAGVTEWRRPEDSSWDPKHRTTSTSRPPRASTRTASSTGFASSIRRTRLPAAPSTNCSSEPRTAAPASGTTCSTTSPSTAAATSCSRRIRVGRSTSPASGSTTSARTR